MQRVDSFLKYSGRAANVAARQPLIGRQQDGRAHEKHGRRTRLGERAFNEAPAFFGRNIEAIQVCGQPIIGSLQMA
jgi:hypothetical protein